MPLRAISNAHTGVAVTTFFMLFAGDGIRSLLGLTVFVAIAVGIALAYAVLLWRARGSVSWRRLPLTLIGFVGLVLVSTAWSADPAQTALTAMALLLTTIGGLGIALLLPWRDLVRALGTTLRWILALSFGYEIYVTRFAGEPIQGIVGSSDQLGFLALISLMVFSLQLVDGTVWRIWGIAWLAVAIGTLALTHSATVLLAAAAALVVIAFVLWARLIGQGSRRGLYAVAFIVILGVVAVGLWATGSLGTGGAFSSVISLTTSSAWVDIWGHLGIIGVIVFGFFVLSTTWRAWFVAVDRPRWDLTDQRPFTATSALPILILAALLVQSLTDNRILVASGWALLVICAVLMKSPTRVHGARS